MIGKLKTLAVSLLPTLLWLLISILAAMVFMLVPFLDSNEDFGIYILMDLAVLIPGIAWLRRYPEREGKGRGKFFGIPFPKILLLVLTGFCLQIVVNFILTLVFAVFPELIGSYAQVMENLGMNSPTLLSVLYTVAAAPVAEEVIYRGLTMRILEESFPFWAANLIQALYFGLIHGNLVQGGYAFLAGLVLGWLVKRNGTVAAGVICHFGVNLSGVLIGLL